MALKYQLIIIFVLRYSFRLFPMYSLWKSNDLIVLPYIRSDGKQNMQICLFVRLVNSKFVRLRLK